MPHLAPVDLEILAGQAFEAAGYGWAAASFSGRDGEIAGRAFDDSQPEKVTEIARGVWGVRVIDSKLALIDKAERFVWQASNRERRVKLHGFVPNDNARRDIVGMAKATFPGSEIDDQMKLARGAPDMGAWLGGVSFGLKQLAGLRRGEMTLENLDLAIAGEATDFASYKGIKSALAAGMPKRLVLKTDAVTPPVVKPFTWSATLKNGGMTLLGHVPTERIRTELLAEIGRIASGMTLVDRMELANGAGEGWPAAALLGVRQLARLEEGVAEINDAQLAITGLATEEAIAVAVREAVQKSVPQGYRVRDQITFRNATVKTVSPFTTAIALDGDGVVLQGHAPTEAKRGAVVAAARTRFPNRRLVDKLEIAAGAADGWDRCLEAGVAVLGRLGNGRVDLTDRKMAVVAVAEEEATGAQATNELVLGAGRLCELDTRISVRQPVEPSLSWTATRGESEILLDGEVPDAATKAELVQTATRLFPGQRISDRQRIANVRPGRWARTAEAGLKSIGQLRAGSARLEAQRLTITGIAPDATVLGAIRDRLGRELPQGYRGSEVIDVRSEAVIWSEQEARRAAAEAEAAQRRKVEEERQRAEAEAARRRSEQERLRVEAESARRKLEDDRQKADAEAARRKAEEERQRADSEAARRKAETDRQRAEAEAASRRRAEEDRQRLEAEAVRRKADEERQSRLSEEARTCQQRLTAATKEGIILFKRASADLDRQSTRTLDQIAAIARNCPGIVIEVEGHTDSEGIPQRNQPLSERRAQAVVDYLARAGISAAALVAIGYGETRPLAPNDSPESMARNRRIEFTVKAK